MKNILVAALFLMLSVSVALGQMNPEAQQKALETARSEVKKLDLLVGKWEGSGWMMQGPQKETFTGTENVQRKVDGLALLVEGKFTNKNNVVIHETLAVVSYNPKTSIFDFNTFLASGYKGVYELRSTADGFEWFVPFPGGKVRYTTKLSAESWWEIGEMSRDEGKTWVKMFEMNLKRVR